MKIFSLLLFCLTGSAWALGPNDVSVLLPLPKASTEVRFLLSPESSGELGELLPLEVFQLLPRIVTDLDEETLYRSALKVVAVRVDPCFQENDGPCQKQIRLVWQPLVNEGGWTTLDASIHTFYTFDSQTWANLLVSLRSLPTENGPTLRVHQKISDEGLGGNHWRAWSALLSKHVGRANLTRATAMSVNPLGNVWFFAGLNISGKEMTPIEIGRVGGNSQAYATQLGTVGQNEFRAAMNPSPLDEEFFLKLLRDSRAAAESFSKEEIISATRSALKMENPRLTNPGNVDCASCHAAHVAPSWAGRKLPMLNWEETFAEDLFKSGPERFLPIPESDANVLRAFGYFKDRPIVSRRVANETAAVLEKFK